MLKPRGLEGELKVAIITSFPNHFKKIDTLFVKDKNTWQSYTVNRVRLTNKFVFLQFEGIQTAEQAEVLRNKELCVSTEQLQELETDEYYIHDLIGLQVFDEQGLLLGTIADVETYPGNDIYVLDNGQGQQYLIPAIRDVIKEVDIQSKRITIHVIEGLLE